jgi:hypothetical protein
MGVDDASYLLRTGYYEYLDDEPSKIYYGGADKQYSLSRMLLSSPNAITDFIIGYAFRSISNDLLLLGTLLDLICSSLALFFLYRFYFELSSSKLSAIAAAFISVWVPYIWIPGSALSVFELSGVYTHRDYLFFDPPALRAVYTQVSFVVFAVLMWRVGRILSKQEIVRSDIISLAILSALNLYIYFFAWISSFAVSIFAIGFVCLSGGETKSVGLITFWKKVGYFGLIYTLISLPGVLQLASLSDQHQTIFEEFSRYFHINIWQLSFGAMLLFVGVVGAGSYRICLIFSAFLILAEFLTMNLQPIVCRELQPFHFPRLYFHPLISGLLTLSLLRLASARSRILEIGMYFALIVFSGVFLMITHSYDEQEVRLRVDQHQLINRIATETGKGDIIAAMTDIDPFRANLGERFTVSSLPNRIRAFSGRSVLFQKWDTFVGSIEELHRELLTGWIYSGQIKPVLPCEDNVTMPGDIFVLTWTAMKLRRRLDCEAFKNIPRSLSPCDLLLRYPVDYVIWEPKLNSTYESEALRSITELVWRSPYGNYNLLRVKKNYREIMGCY